MYFAITMSRVLFFFKNKKTRRFPPRYIVADHSTDTGEKRPGREIGEVPFPFLIFLVNATQCLKLQEKIKIKNVL